MKSTIKFRYAVPVALALAAALWAAVPASAWASSVPSHALSPHQITFEDIQGWLMNIARGAAVIGIMLFALTLIIPGDTISIFGLQIPQNYLIRVAVGALLICAASTIAGILFGV